jgi:CBS domain-containing protein
VEAEHALDNRELPGSHVLRRVKRPAAMAVHRLEDGLALTEVEQVLLEDVEVVAVRVQRRHPPLGALMAVDADGKLRGVITIEQLRRALSTAGAP